MTVQSGDQSLPSSLRGQSTVLGIVLLIGMVAVGSTALFLVATDSISSVEQDAEHDRVESGFVELSQQMEAASTSGDIPQSMDMDVGDSSAVVMEETGTLRIQGGEVDETVTIGSIEYTGEDDTKIAYQAGGVFRETGAETRVVSAPPIQYHTDTETLTYPIIKTQDKDEISTGEIGTEYNDSESLHDTGLVENDTVTVEVTSEYYRGWEQYFDEQSQAGSVTNVEDYGNETGTVTAEFGYYNLGEAFDTGARLPGGCNLHPGGGSHQESDCDEENADNVDLGIDDSGVGMQDINDLIDEMANDTNTSEHREWAGSGPLTMAGDEEEEFESGTYYTDDVYLEDDLNFNLSSGNATLVVDEDVDLNGHDISVDNWNQSGQENELRIYMKGDLTTGGGDQEICADPCNGDNSKQLQIYGQSDSTAMFGTGSSYVEGLFYMASPESDYNDEYQVNIQSSVEFHGAIVASSMSGDTGQGSFSMDYDETVQGEDIDIYPADYSAPPQLTYLNVAEHIVDIDAE